MKNNFTQANTNSRKENEQSSENNNYYGLLDNHQSKIEDEQFTSFPISQFKTHGLNEELSNNSFSLNEWDFDILQNFNFEENNYTENEVNLEKEVIWNCSYLKEQYETGAKGSNTALEKPHFNEYNSSGEKEVDFQQSVIWNCSYLKEQYETGAKGNNTALDNLHFTKFEEIVFDMGADLNNNVMNNMLRNNNFDWNTEQCTDFGENALESLPII
tara:strand:- start:1088 stop:1732 length:645 start_codon:yes stop_codon:yes gene_type:complete